MDFMTENKAQSHGVAKLKAASLSYDQIENLA